MTETSKPLHIKFQNKVRHDKTHVKKDIPRIYTSLYTLRIDDIFPYYPFLDINSHHKQSSFLQGPISFLFLIRRKYDNSYGFV